MHRFCRALFGSWLSGLPQRASAAISWQLISLVASGVLPVLSSPCCPGRIRSTRCAVRGSTYRLPPQPPHSVTSSPFLRCALTTSHALSLPYFSHAHSTSPPTSADSDDGATATTTLPSQSATRLTRTTTISITPRASNHSPLPQHMKCSLPPPSHPPPPSSPPLPPLPSSTSPPPPSPPSRHPRPPPIEMLCLQHEMHDVHKRYWRNRYTRQVQVDV